VVDRCAGATPGCLGAFEKNLANRGVAAPRVDFRKIVVKPSARLRLPVEESEKNTRAVNPARLSNRRREEVKRMTTKKTVHSDAVLATQLIAGTNKHFANAGQLAFASASFTPAQVTTHLQALVQLRADVDAAKVVTQAKLAVLRADMPTERAFMDAFVSFVKATFSKSPDVLADFGLKPKKAATPPTVDAKAAAVAKRASTRAARNTKGAKQRKAVKGDVTGVVVTPVKAAPVETPNAAPAPPTPGTPAGTAPHTSS
jgi:hypothetical protein